MRTENYYRYPHPRNVGDTLTPFILDHFTEGIKFKLVRESVPKKFIGIGSVMRVIQPGDVIWGTGVMRETDTFPNAPLCKFLAVRGKLSREKIIASGGSVPEVYGDPALLLPLMYKPEIEVTHEVGIIPHYIDSHLITNSKGNELAGTLSWKLIDVFDDYQTFIDQVLSCKRVISSSLHGLIIAEAYGLPVEWVVLSNKVIGEGFKFRDYLTGTGRLVQGPGEFPILDRDILTATQAGLLQALTAHFNNESNRGEASLLQGKESL